MKKIEIRYINDLLFYILLFLAFLMLQGIIHHYRNGLDIPKI